MLILYIAIPFLATSLILGLAAKPIFQASNYPKHSIEKQVEAVPPAKKKQKEEKPVPQKGLTEEEQRDYAKALETMKACVKDEDCAPVPEGPCGCGGMGKNTAVNKAYVDEYKEWNQKKYTGTFCFATMSNDLSCIAPPLCINSRCTIDTKKPEVCEKSRDPNRCYYEFAINKKEVALCDKLQTEKINSSRQSCLTNLATAKDDLTICDDLKDSQRIACRDDYFYRKARKKKDFELCFQMNEGADREDCLYSLIANGDDEESCKKLADEEKQELCVSNILFNRALAKKDPEICFGIPIETGPYQSRTRCLNRTAPYVGKLEYCNLDPEDKSDSFTSCVRDIAKKNGDYTVCMKIEAEDHQYSCTIDTLISGSVGYKDAILACRTLTSEGRRNRKADCLGKVSTFFLNNTFCSEALDPEDCERRIEKDLATTSGQNRLKRLKE